MMCLLDKLWYVYIQPLLILIREYLLNALQAQTVFLTLFLNFDGKDLI